MEEAAVTRDDVKRIREACDLALQPPASGGLPGSLGLFDAMFSLRALDLAIRSCGYVGASERAYSSWFYVARSEDGLVKVGISETPTKRVKSLRGATGKRVAMVAALPPRAKLLEECVLRRLGPHRAEGEWLRPHPDVEAFAAACEVVAAGVSP